MGKYYNAQLGMTNTPNEMYRELSQQTVIDQWSNTTVLETIKEENYPFNETYIEYEAWINGVSEVTVNTKKVVGDYIDVMFKDMTHEVNHRGQKYLYEDNYYLCYDVLDDKAPVPHTKLVRCNNYIKWLDSNGNVKQEPCFIGEEISSTNNQISKDSTIGNSRMVCLVQGNNATKELKENQRFIISHSQAFKVTQINRYVQEDYVTEEVPLYTMYIEWSSILASDNLALNLADYYTSNYTLQIDQSDLSILPSSTGQLTATTTLNSNPITVPLTWTSSNPLVATIDQNGNYNIVGLSGTTCTITCTIKGNEQVTDSINISVASVPTSTKVLTVIPNELASIKLNTTKTIGYGVYINGVKQSDVVIVTYSGATSDCYSKVDITDGVEIKCLKTSSTPLQITFTSGSLTKTMSIKLIGII